MYISYAILLSITHGQACIPRAWKQQCSFEHLETPDLESLHTNNSTTAKQRNPKTIKVGNAKMGMKFYITKTLHKSPLPIQTLFIADTYD